MSRRLFPDNDAWTDEARHASNDIAVAFADILAILLKLMMIGRISHLKMPRGYTAEFLLATW
jgi:hypothetical protein